MSELKFRDFVESDFPEYRSWYRKDRLLDQFLGPMEAGDEWLAAVLNPQPNEQTIAAVLVEADVEQLVGVMNLVIENLACVIPAIAVHPDFRSRGYGKLMLEHLSSKYKTLVVHVDRENSPALGFFDRYGFARGSVQENMVTMHLRTADVG